MDRRLFVTAASFLSSAADNGSLRLVAVALPVALWRCSMGVMSTGGVTTSLTPSTSPSVRGESHRIRDIR